MRKTTVYLPEALKRRLARVARNEQLSEAEVIRRAVEQFMDGRAAPSPRLPLFAPGEVAPIDDFDDALRGFGSG